MLAASCKGEWLSAPLAPGWPAGKDCLEGLAVTRLDGSTTWPSTRQLPVRPDRLRRRLQWPWQEGSGATGSSSRLLHTSSGPILSVACGVQRCRQGLHCILRLSRDRDVMGRQVPYVALPLSPVGLLMCSCKPFPLVAPRQTSAAATALTERPSARGTGLPSANGAPWIGLLGLQSLNACPFLLGHIPCTAPRRRKGGSLWAAPVS